MINYLDLFSGCGGFRLGLERAGFKFKWEGHSEIDKYAKQVYVKHFPDSEDLGDVRTIQPDSLPRIDLITFGFPCQDLSVAGKGGGLEADRSGLFYEALRIIEAAQPEVFIFENVKGLLTKSKPWFLSVLKAVADLGLYDCEWQLLNTRWFLPQNRERLYFIGRLRGRGGPKVFPIGEGAKDAQDEGAGFKNGLWAQAIDSSYYKGTGGKRPMIQIGHLSTNAEAHRVYSSEGIARTIKDGGGMGAKTGLYVINTKQVGPARWTKECATIGANDFKELKLVGYKTAQDLHGVDTGGNIRRLTPTECERLQGFPDGWTEANSDTQRYKMIGNAVSVPVVEAIGKKLYKTHP
jgi:DNA (cytosine-5)-methyltransferase 1